MAPRARTRKGTRREGLRRRRARTRQTEAKTVTPRRSLCQNSSSLRPPSSRRASPARRGPKHSSKWFFKGKAIFTKVKFFETDLWDFYPKKRAFFFGKYLFSWILRSVLAIFKNFFIWLKRWTCSAARARTKAKTARTTAVWTCACSPSAPRTAPPRNARTGSSPRLDFIVSLKRSHSSCVESALRGIMERVMVRNFLFPASSHYFLTHHLSFRLTRKIICDLKIT